VAHADRVLAGDAARCGDHVAAINSNELRDLAVAGRLRVLKQRKGNIRNANPDNDFRYDATLGGSGGYVYNLSTRSLSIGTWVLSITAAGDPTTHTVQFDVR
jgi:hypothetical protein